jgi:hypothetical protein
VYVNLKGFGIQSDKTVITILGLLASPQRMVSVYDSLPQDLILPVSLFLMEYFMHENPREQSAIQPRSFEPW